MKMILSIFPFFLLILKVQSQLKDSEPSEESLIGLCKPIACPPVDCVQGTHRVQKGCECPFCVSDDPSQENLALGRPPTPKPSIESANNCTCKVECAEGTRLVKNPTRCSNPRCVANGIPDEWEKPRPPGIVGLCFQPPDVPVDCGNGTQLVQDKSQCGCGKCVPINPSVESVQCPPCRVQCAVGTRLVHSPTRCSNPRCVADGIPDEWEKPREPGIDGLCYQPPDVPVDCGNGTQLVQDKSQCGCGRCVPINPSVDSNQCPLCKIECAPGTRLVQDPTRCHNPRCVADGIEDEWEKPRPPGIVGLCFQPPDVPVECGNGTKKVREVGHCKCHKCVPITQSPHPESLFPSSVHCEPIACPQVLCAVGTHRVNDPHGCSCPKCVPDHDCSPPVLHCKPQICPAIVCPLNSIRFEDPQGCRCPICHPRSALQSLSEESNLHGVSGILKGVLCKYICPEVKCPEGQTPQRDHRYVCSCPKCQPRPASCPPVICPACPKDSYMFDDPEGCKCPVCYPFSSFQSLSVESIFDGIQCKIFCLPVKCPEGQTPQRDHRYVCSCPRCQPSQESAIMDIPGAICDIACPALSCGPNHHLVRTPGLCSCPRCELNPIRPPCTPVICPAIACAEDSIIVEDPQGCRCPVCHPRSLLQSQQLDTSAIQCKFICPQVNCPTGESPQRDHRFVCGCPTCQPDQNPITQSIADDVICDYACPQLKCPAGQEPVRDPAVKCGCPKCKPVQTCKPVLCPQVQCEEGEIRIQDPEGCSCPICYRPTDLESAQAEELLIPIQCKFICRPLTCPAGQTPKRDHRYTCGCPRCVADDDLTVLSSLEGVTSDFACRPCPAGTYPFRIPGEVGCPICIRLKRFL